MGLTSAVYNRLFNIASLTSAVVCCILLTATAMSLAGRAYLPFLSVTDEFHVMISPMEAVFCNDMEYGPYCGSITVGIAGDPNLPKISGFSDFPGIYYQHFRWPDQTTLWGLRLNLAYPLVVTGALPLTWWIRRQIRRRDLARRGFPVSNRSQ